MFKTLFALSLKFGLATAEKDIRFQVFKLVYNKLNIGTVLLEMAAKSENKVDDKAVETFNSILKDDTN